VNTAFAVMMLFALLMIVAVIIVIPMVIVAATKPARQERKRNLAAPVLTEFARVIGQREALTHDSNTPLVQTHYATFEFSDGNRLELAIPAAQAGLIATGDQGQLTWRGTWFQGFAREIMR
jgi:hypothetical protein